MSTALTPDDDQVRMLGEWQEQIRVRLNRDRPTRYSRADSAWMEPTIAWARGHQPLDDIEVVRLAARNAVVAVESKSNRQANNLIKRFAGQGVLFWSDLGPLPFTLDERNGFRVRFDAATPDDFDTKAQLIRESADRRRDAEYVVADWLESCANEARVAGYERVAEIGDKGDPLDMSDDEFDEEDDLP